MKAWRPIADNTSSICTFLTVGVIFVALGAFLLYTDSDVREIRLDYTQCSSLSNQNELETMPSANVQQHFKASTTGQPSPQWMRSESERTFDGVTKNYTTCVLDFYIPETLKAPIYFYYRLTDIVQNHRYYGTSFDKKQLAGQNESISDLKNSCDRLYSGSTNEDGTERIIYPCGSIANSVFNDSFADPRRFLDASNKDGQLVTYNMSRINITTELNKELFKETTYTIPDQAGANDSIIEPPPNWAERYPNGYHSGNMFNPAEDEAFMVWMRTSASPTFAKLAMRNDDNDMQRGVYRLEVFSHFPIEEIGGTKSILITTKSNTMGRVQFLSKAYIASGAAGILLGIFFVLSTMHKPPPLKNHEYLHKQ